MTTTHIKMYRAADYCIKVSGTIDKEWFSYHDNMVVEEVDMGEQRPLTILTGQVTDQAALMGILNHLYDLQLPLVSVEYLFEE